MWTVVGSVLIIVGTRWATRGGVRPALPFLALAAVIGWLKGRYVLSRSAVRIARRIEVRGDDRCLGGFLSWKSWILVASMMILGRLLRMSPLPVLYRGLIYSAIGVALLSGGITLWRWRLAAGEAVGRSE
jgi:hypothetical protein